MRRRRRSARRALQLSQEDAAAVLERRAHLAAGRAARAARRQNMESRTASAIERDSQKAAGPSEQRLPLQNITNTHQRSSPAGHEAPAAQPGSNAPHSQLPPHPRPPVALPF